MASCNICGYWHPDGAKKCATCGADLDTRLPRKAWLLGWKLFATLVSLGALFASIATCFMANTMKHQTKSMENQATLFEAQTDAIKSQAASIADQTGILKKNFELTYIPVVKIGPIAFNFVQYNDGTPLGSVAMYFTIPIENKHGYAYNVKITKKDLKLLRGPFNLETPSLQSPLTKRSFELSPGQIRYDQIAIDENVPNFETVMRGEDSFKLAYTIEYEAMPEVKRGTYMYNYLIEFKGGQQEIKTEETIPPKGGE